MKNLFSRLVYACAVLLMVSPLVSCGGGGGGESVGTGTGTLSLGLTDAPGDYQHVWVTIKEIQVNKATEEEDDGSGWLPAFTIEETIDLKTLENGEIFDFGLAELEAGQYNQMRLIIDEVKIAPHPFANYLVIEGAQEEEYVIGEPGEYYAIEELEVPGGVETGIKIHKFEIEEQGTTALVLDFDAKTSVVKNGKSGKWHLKPNIKVLETVQNSIGDNAIADSVGGVNVSAQIYTPEPADPPWDPMDEVTVEGTSESRDDDGYYKIYLPPNTYNVVATKDGFIPECLEVEAEFYEELTDVDFSLVSLGEEYKIISGYVSGLATDTDTAYLGIRQNDFDCGGAGPVTIEVASAQPVNGVEYIIKVPAGTYDLVATDGTTTMVYEGLDIDANTVRDTIDFTPAP